MSQHLIPSEAQALIAGATSFVEGYMSAPPFDPSHDFSHIRRVLALSAHLAAAYERERPGLALNRVLLQLVAILHDVSDHKYASAAAAASPESVLLGLGCPPALAALVQRLAVAVSVSLELREPARAAELAQAHPELAVVQDADRLDAMGAVGAGRAFTFGGAQRRSLTQSIDHFEEKLLVRERLMRTAEARRMAAVRADRLRAIRRWWDEEMAEAGVGVGLQNGVGGKASEAG